MAIKISRTFLLRKLHQMTGVVPLGVFYFFHLFANSRALNGKDSYNRHVQEIHDLPYLLFIEILTIFLPLIFHSVYGIFISAEARTNVLSYGYKHNWFYILQRITGIFLFFFLFFHILNFRFGLLPGLNTTPVSGNADIAFDVVASEFSIPWVMTIYILGVAATAWHLAYGLFLFAVDWGIVIGEKAQKNAIYICMIIAVIMFFLGVNSAVSFIRPDGLTQDLLHF
jgi:succinate dehydrogenase / fumarate reductase cytochrome b subunit